MTELLRKSHGTAILILGIVGLIYFIAAPIAWIWGNREIKDIEAGIRDPMGERMVRIGRVLGIIGTVFWLVGGGLLLLIAFFPPPMS